MDNLKELQVKVSRNLDYANVCIDLSTLSATSLGSVRHQPELNMMNNEEIELALSCAMNIKKHLTRVLEMNAEKGLQNKLQYVNNLIQEGGLRANLN
jgi:hypothetical protein